MLPSLTSIPKRTLLLRAGALALTTIGLTPHAWLRGHADDVGFPHQHLDVIDRVLGGGHLPSAVLQHLLSAPGPTRTLFDVAMMAIYLLWLPVTWLVLAWVIGWRWNHYPRIALTFFGVFYLGDVIHMLMPVEPPWMLSEVERTIVERTVDFVNLDPNPVAAFPSLHVAVPAALAFQARRCSMPLMSRRLLIFAALTALAVVQLGEHYVVDAVGGVVFAAFVAWLVGRIPMFRPAAETETDQRLTTPEPARLAA